MSNGTHKRQCDEFVIKVCRESERRLETFEHFMELSGFPLDMERIAQQEKRAVRNGNKKMQAHFKKLRELLAAGQGKREIEVLITRETITCNGEIIHHDESIGRHTPETAVIDGEFRTPRFVAKYEHQLSEAAREIFEKLSTDIVRDVLGYEFERGFTTPAQVTFIWDDERLQPIWKEASKINKKNKKLTGEERQRMIKAAYPELPDELVAELVDKSGTGLRGEGSGKENHPSELALKHAAMNAGLKYATYHLKRLRRQLRERYPDATNLSDDERKYWMDQGNALKHSIEFIGEIG